MTPFIVVAFNAMGTPLFLWPFGCRKLGGLRVVEFLGGKHANFNMALWRRDVAAKIGADDLRAALSAPCRARRPRQAHQPAADLGRHHQSVRAAAAAAFGQFRLQRRAGARLRRAVARPHQCGRPQEDAQEGAHARELWRGSLRAGARRRRRAPRARRLLQAEERAHAQLWASRMFSRHPACGASSRRRRPSSMPAASRRSNSTRFRSTTSSWRPWAASSAAGASAPCSIRSRKAATPIESPGEQLIVNLVRGCCERGLDTFDLGIGEAHYKNFVLRRCRAAVRQLPAAQRRRAAAGHRVRHRRLGQAHHQATCGIVVAGARGAPPARAALRHALI